MRSETTYVSIQYPHQTRTHIISFSGDAFVLYQQSFVNDLDEFATCVLEDKRECLHIRTSRHPIHTILPALSLQPEDALEASKIATALQYSFRNRVAVEFDDEGEPIMP